MMFGSYSKGNANPDSDIDVAVIVPTYGGRKMEISKLLWNDVDKERMHTPIMTTI